MELASTKNTVEPGLKGWLILPMLALIVQIVAFFNSLRGFMNAPAPFRISLNIWILLYNIIVVVLTLHVAYFFFKKKDVTPVYFILYRIVLFVPWVFIFLAGDKFPLTSAAQASLAQPFIAHAIGLLIFIPYFVWSKRVKATFTQPLEPHNWQDKILTGMQPFFKKTETFLWKNRKFLILEVIGLIAVTLFLGIVITSI